MRASYKLKVWSTVVVLLFVSNIYAQQYDVISPNGLLKISLIVGADIKYAVSYDGTSLMAPSTIAVSLNTGLVLGANAAVSTTEIREVNQPIARLYGKNDITEHFNELKIVFTENYSLIVRAYDEGVAYRFVTTLGGDVIVNSETAEFNLAGTPGVIFPEADVDLRSWERSYYTYNSISDIAVNRFSVTPTMFSFTSSGIRVVIAESDLMDYPGMYVQRTATGMKGKWAQYPKTVSDPTDVYKYHRVLTRETFLAKTSGSREYPWRVVIVSSEDKELLSNELIYKLATPSVLTNTDYIKPGKSAWEWWFDGILDTKVIPSGPGNYNTNFYNYFVDFAAQYNLEYITLDAQANADVAQVCQYAASKNVKVFVWDFVNLDVENPLRFAQLKSLGIAGVKIDLIERDDQIAINWFQQLAQGCADNNLMVAFHGCGKPTGLQRTYPNIVNFEAVRGAENDKWDNSANADYHLQFPFIRMLAGSLDYTPGSMRNVHKSQFTPTGTGIPKSIGTRAHELAMYVMFDQPLGYLCDSPTEYRKYSDVMSFLSNVPTTWDKTTPLAASVGEYAIVARQKGTEWYVGAMTNSVTRDVEIDLSFLPDANDRTAEIFHDTDGTDINAKIYKRDAVIVNNQTKLAYTLFAEGGLVVRIHDGVITGTNEVKPKSKIKVYTNQESTKLTIEADEPIRSVSIFDLAGRTCYQNIIQDVAKTVSSEDITSLTSGLYLVNVTTASGIYTVKFAR